MSGEDEMREDYNRETLRVRPYPPSLSRVGEKVAEQAAEINRLTAEVERLAEWKRSAIGVLAAWDAVFDALGQPGPLGGSKAENALAEVERLRDLLDEAHDSLPWCECCDVMGRPCSIGAALGESTPAPIDDRTERWIEKVKADAKPGPKHALSESTPEVPSDG